MEIQANEPTSRERATHTRHVPLITSSDPITTVLPYLPISRYENDDYLPQFCNYLLHTSVKQAVILQKSSNNFQFGSRRPWSTSFRNRSTLDRESFLSGFFGDRQASNWLITSLMYVVYIACICCVCVLIFFNMFRNINLNATQKFQTTGNRIVVSFWIGDALPISL